tara:strand:+ start:37 stop:324 length:288 start_codon:yes stop_codon:yes gene_type:complete
MLKLVTEERRDHIRIGILYNRHHDEARHDKLHVLVSTHFADAPTDQVPKDYEVEPDRDCWWHQSLQPDSGKASNFLYDNSFKRYVFVIREHDGSF